jgi:PAS domain S-box-containing protein
MSSHTNEEALLRIVQESSISTFAINEEHLVTHWNRACENLTGIPASEVVGTNGQWKAFYSEKRSTLADFLVAESTEDEIRKYYGGRYRKSALVEGAYEVQGYLGESGKWLFFTAAPLRDPEGNVVGAIETLQDITERRIEEIIKAEASKKIKKEYEDLAESTVQIAHIEKLAGMNDLSSGLRHELKQPINAAKIICQSVVNDIKKDRLNLEELKEDLPEIITQLNRITETIEHMGTISKHSQESNKETIILNDVAVNALKLIGQQLKDLNIEVVKELYSGLPPIAGDPVSLEQVILGLIINAKNAVEKSEKEDKKIKIATFKTDDNRAVVMEVRDNGIGIPADLREKIFEPTFTTNKGAKAKGLGLSIFKETIKKHNGRIEVGANINDFTTFRVILPTIS